MNQLTKWGINKLKYPASNDVVYWLGKAYTHLDSGLLTEDDMAQIEPLAQAYYDALDAAKAPDPDESESDPDEPE